MTWSGAGNTSTCSIGSRTVRAEHRQLVIAHGRRRPGYGRARGRRTSTLRRPMTRPPHPRAAGRGRRRRCSTTTSTAGCGRRRSIELAREYGYRGLPTTDVDDLAHWFNRGAKRNDLVLYLETFAHTVGVMQHKDAIERVAFECAAGPRRRRRRVRRGAHGARAVHRGRADARRGDAGDPRRLRPGLGGDRPDDLRHRHGDAHGGAQPGDRRAGRALARRRRRRVRHRRRRGRLPADPPPRRVPVRDAGELPHHDPRRRGVRPAEHLGGRAVVRRRAPRPRRAHRRRHHRPARQRAARAAGRLRPRHADPARAVPDVERQHGRRAARSASTRSRCCAGCASASR